MLLLVLVAGALQLNVVQTWLARQLTSYLSSELHTDLSIDKVSIRFFNSIVLKGVYVEDLHKDTLLYAGLMKVNIGNISTSEKKLSINGIMLEDATFSLNRYAGEAHDNIKFLTDYFASDHPDTASSAWDVRLSKLVLSDITFQRRVEEDSVIPYGVDFSNLLVRNIHGSFKNLSTSGDSLYVTVDKLRFEDQSGFRLEELSSVAMISPVFMRLDGLVIRTPDTDLHTDLTFSYDSLASFDDFENSVRWNSNFSKTLVSFRDIAYFAPELEGLDKVVGLDGLFRGTVARFRGKDVTLSWGSRSSFKGDISMTGLPYIEDTHIDLDAEKITTNIQDVEWIPLAPFTDSAHVRLPANLAALGEVSFTGKFTGFVNDFVAYGSAQTAIGRVETDLNLKYDERSGRQVYSGHLAAVNFNAGKIAGMNDLGRISFRAEVKGSGMRLDNMSAKLDGKISLLEFRGYPYSQIDIDGEISKKMFNGALEVSEPNVDFTFRGSIDYRSKLPEFNFIADVRRAHLDTLNLFRLGGGEHVLQTRVQTSFSGNSADNIVGNIYVENTNFLSGKKMYRINAISVSALKLQNIRQVDIESDNLNASFRGDFELATLADAFKEIIPRYLPSVILPKKEFISRQNFTYNIRLKNLSVITENFLPSWYFAPNTLLSGHFNSMNHDFSLQVISPQIRLNDLLVENFSVNSQGSRNEMSLQVYANALKIGDAYRIDYPELQSVMRDDRIGFTLSLADADTFPNRAHLEGNMQFYAANDYILKIDSALIMIRNEEWKLNPMNMVHFDSTGIAVRNLYFSREYEAIRFEGRIGRSEQDQLGVHFANFRLEQLNALLNTGDLLGGVVNGDVRFSDMMNKLQVKSDLNILNLSLEGDTVGHASILSRYSNDQKVVVTNASVMKGTVKVVDIRGNYFAARTDNNLDFDVRLNSFYLHPFERYVTGVLSEVYGKVTADLKLTGSLNEPVFTGSVDLVKASLIVDYLNTRYSFTSRVLVDKNQFEIPELKLIDSENNEAIVTGYVFHNFFRNFRFDVEVLPEQFHVLNTTAEHNPMYYGTGYATGYARFQGPLENINMDISLTPDKGTLLNIPLNTAEELTYSNFITFIDRTKDTAQSVRPRVDLSGIRLNMSLDMNRNAAINIIFDEKIGDIISGTGSGSLRLDINSTGQFNMYGTYDIEKGDYLFTLQNLINKKFNIDPGSSITWAGDPLEATVDISAVYVVYTSSLYNVLADSSYRRRVPVDLKLFLKNKLMNPTISYEINVRGLDPTAQGLVRTMMNSEQEVNRQMFGLLVLNQFLPQSGPGAASAVNAGAGAGASASELLSNQVSNWLGQLSKDVSIGFNYRAGDTYSSDEVQLLFSKSLFEDRLTLEGNVGYLGNSQTAQNTNSLVGDFYAEYKLSQDGRLRVKGFNRSNADNIINYSQAAYTQGLGVFFRQEFNSFRDLLMRLKIINRNKSNDTSLNE